MSGAGKGPEWRSGTDFKRYRESPIWEKIGPDARRKREEQKDQQKRKPAENTIDKIQSYASGGEI